MNLNRTAALVLSAALAVSSCGGGGGGGDGGPTLALFVGEMDTPDAVDGIGTAARLNHPQGIARDGTGNLYVADTGNHTIRKVTPAGSVSTFAGTAGIVGSADGTGPAASFFAPTGITIDPVGNLFVTDRGNHTVRVITPQAVVTTLAGAVGSPGSHDDTGTAASFRFPSGIATDSAGNLIVVDTGNHTIRMITPQGEVSTLAGAAGLTGSVDGSRASARFHFDLSSFSGVALDGAGNIYVADFNNHTIRKITVGGDVTTFAGEAGVPGNVSGTGADARLCQPMGAATDKTGNFYVVSCATVRKITPAAAVTSVVGSFPDWQPGPLPGKLPFPVAVAVGDTTLHITFLSAIAIVQGRP